MKVKIESAKQFIFKKIIVAIIKCIPILSFLEIGYEVYKVDKASEVVQKATVIEYAKNYILDTKIYMDNKQDVVKITKRLKELGINDIDESTVKIIIEDLSKTSSH